MISNKKDFFLGLLLIFGTLTLYAPTLFFQFIYYDDNEYVFENLHIQAGLFHSSFWNWLPTAIVSANWHPLTLVSHALDWQIYGAWPGGHHLTAVLLHSINAFFVFILFSRMTSSSVKSFLIAALFAWHPVKVESVAWIAERKDVLSTCFALLSMLAYTTYVYRIKQSLKSKTTLFFSLSCFLFALSLLCKSMYVTLPAILFLFDFWPLARKDKKAIALLIEKIPFAVLSALFCIITMKAQSSGGAIHHFADYPLPVKIANICQAYWDYIFLFLWPAKLSIFYPYIPNAHVMNSLMLGAVLAILSFILLLRWKKTPALTMGWFLFGITLFPVSGVVTIGAHWIACRYLYWPSIGLSILIIWGGEKLLSKINFPKKGILILICGILLACLGITSVYLEKWQNSYKLFQHAADTIPHNWVAHVNLRAAYGRDGHHLKAAEHLIEAIKIFPDITNRMPLHWLDFYYMGKVNWNKGQKKQAESYLREAARRIEKEPPANLHEDSRPEREEITACLQAFESNQLENCKL